MNKLLQPQLYASCIRLMGLSLVQVFIICAFSIVSLANVSRAQEMMARKITLQLQNSDLRTVLNQIEREADVKFVYSKELIRSHRTVSFSAVEQPLAEALHALFGPLKISYKVVSGRILLQNEVSSESGLPTRRKPAGSAEVTPAAPDKTVKGKVTDASGELLIGVNVVVKGTVIGNVSGADGTYTINVPDGATTLVFSFIGHVTREVEIEGRSVIDVALETDIKSLSEVVVVGYGVQKKETVTGSVATVKGDELVKSPTVNLSNSIAGRMPGVIATNRSGEPGYDGSSIRIRGSNTLGNNDALIVIDGIPARAGGLDRLNPADVENISVLKDAAAAIYGSRAANGVILITTKRGKTGKPELSYSFNQGWGQPTVIPKLANAAQFAEMRNELNIYELPVSEWKAAYDAFNSTGSYTRPSGEVRKAPFSPEDIQKFRDGSDPWFHPNTNWYDATLKQWSPQVRHNLQLSGGNENFKYLTSLGYQNQDAYYKNSATAYKQYDVRINLDGNINKYLKTSIGVLGRQENRQFPTKSAGAIFRMSMRGIPTQPAFWPNGKPGPDIEYGENPVVITTNQTGYDRDTRYYFQTNGTVDFTVPGVKGLKFTGTASVDKYVKQTKRWETPWYLYTWQGEYEADGTTPKLVAGKRGPAEPRLNQGNEDQLNVLLGLVGSYERTFGDHGVTFLAGTNKETISNASFGAFRRYYISDAVDQIFAGGDLEKNNSGSAWERARINYFGRVAYNFREKYMAEFLWRYDGSYMFPANTRYGFFPGIMAGWVISEENFWKSGVKAVNYLKLRGSWGQMGNDQIYYNDVLQEYQYLSTYGFSSYIIDGKEVKTLNEIRVPNLSVTWEVANNANIGLEGQLFNGAINFEFDVFRNNRSRILYPRNASIPQTTGMTLPAENIGKVKNSGFDFLVGYNGNIGELRYNVSVNGGYAYNEIVFWDEAPGSPEWQRTTGKPMQSGYLVYLYDGVFKDEAEIQAEQEKYNAINKSLRPGDMKYKDYNNDGVINGDDRVRRTRNNLPRFQGGFNLSASYKGLDLTVLFQGATGAEQYISTGESGNIGNYLLDVYENRWSIGNPSSVHPRITNRNDQYYSGGNTYWLRNRDYLRLKNLEVGYTLPEGLTKKVGIGNLRVYVNGLNLVTWDKLKVFDPESDNTTGQYYPQSRILNTGLTVTF